MDASEKHRDANHADLAKDLVAHIRWCLSEFSSDPEMQEAGARDRENHNGSWVAFRTLQNHLHLFLNQESEQCAAVAVLLIHLINQVFSDLCTNTPWDGRQIINKARTQAETALLELLKHYASCLEDGVDVDKHLWQAFRRFVGLYNSILANIDEQDLAYINELRFKEVGKSVPNL